MITGDVTGPQATSDLARALPALRHHHRLDAALVIGDNTSITGPAPMGGSGMTVQDRDILLHAGADLILTGSHVWDPPDAAEAVSHPQVLRCANLIDTGRPGHGTAVLDINGEQLAVVQLGDPAAVNGASHPYENWHAVRPRVATLVHFVADIWHACLLASVLDGQCAVLVNSLSHVATRDLQILPNGTAFVADVGYVGPPGGVGGFGGFEPRHFVAAYLGHDTSGLAPYRLTQGPTQMSAVLADVDTETGHIREFSWIRSLQTH
jgi:2',3'-cyclic-nucleotide 2'-phosphodiesterase